MVKKVILTMVILPFFLLTNCDLKEPVLPSWEVLVRIPFTIENFAIGDSILKDPSITLQPGDTSGVLYISIDGELDAHELTPEDLSITLNARRDSVFLDTLTLLPQPLQTPFISLRTLFPELSNFVGQTVTIPETTFTPPSIVLSAGDFERIHFVNSLLALHVNNNLPFALGPNNTSNGLQVSLWNHNINEQFLTFPFPNSIPAGTQAQESSLVAQKWLVSPIRYEYEFPIAQPVTLFITDSLLDSSGLTFTLEFVDVKADEAVAEFDAQHYQDIVRNAYDGERRLISASVNRGKITLEFVNNISLGSQVELTFPAIDTNPDPFSRDSLQTAFTLPAFSTLIQEIDLNGWEISNPQNPNLPIDTLEILVDAITEDPAGIIHLRATDNVVVNVQSDTIFFNTLRGILSSDTLTFAPIVREDLADYEGFEGGIELSSASLSLTIYSEVFIENMTADITFTGYHKNRQGVITDSATLALSNLSFVGGTPGNPGVTHILFPGQEVIDFLNILPTSFKFGGRVITSGEADVTVGDRIRAEYAFETPLKAKISGLATYQASVDTLTDEDISDEIQDVPDDNFLTAALNVQVLNHTPLGGTATLILTADFSDPDIYDADFDTTQTIVRTITINAADVDPVTGFVLAEKANLINVGLNKRELQLIKNPPLKVGFQILIHDTPDFVTLRKSDYIRVNGGFDFRLLVRGDN